MAVIGTNYSRNIADISGNNYNAELIGTTIKKDEDNKYYFDLDGSDDYINICTLPSTINWQDGFTVEFEARWDALYDWSRIFEAANGPNSDNIIIANFGTTNSIGIGIINGSTNEGYQENIGLINIGEKNKYKLEFIKNDNNINYTFKIYKDNILKYTGTSNHLLRNLDRVNNYIGKSNWSSNKYFKGRIYNLNIYEANGKKILNYDINEWVK